jgi:biotin carboxylase
MAEDRELFRRAMADIGLETARARIAHSMEEALAVQSEIGFPTVIRPSFTLGGSGGGIAYNREEFEAIVARGLDASPTNEVLLEESVLGWKEYEMEVVRDHGRFDHRGAGANPHRPRISAAAGCLDRGAAQDRRRHRRLERAVRHQSG